jgi:hypothetical protein
MYTIKYNLIGQEVYRTTVNFIAGENNISIMPDKKLASGSYILKISNTEIESQAWFNVFE